MPEKIRLGVVGYGRRGASLFDLAAKSFAVVAPSAICDLDPANRAAGEAKYPGVSLHADMEDMISRAKLDALIIATPATQHAKLGVEALSRNIHVLSEIPVVASVAEAGELWLAQQRSPAIYMTGANPNLWGFVDAATRLVKEGALGTPYYMEAGYIHDIRYLFEKTPWRRTYESIRYCTHSLGPLLRLMEEDLEWVSCFSTGSHVNQEAGQNDAMVAIFRTRNNVVVKLLTSFINHFPGMTHEYRVFGTRGYFERRNGRTRFYATAAHTEQKLVDLPVGEMPAGLEVVADAAEHGGADYALLQKFLHAIEHRLPSPISLREGLRMTLPGLFAAESAQAGGRLTRIRYPWNQA